MKVNSNRLYFTPGKENLIFRGGYARIRPLHEKPRRTAPGLGGAVFRKDYAVSFLLRFR